jgi:ADP-ribose pyrophosphatase
MADVRKTLLETRKFKVVRVEQLAPDGRIHKREIVVHPGAVTIIPMVDQNHVCLIKNFRVAVGRILIELPAGTLEPNEDPTETARRELTEETGYHAEEMTSLSKFCMSPGILDEVMYLYLAQGLSPGSASLEDDEQIETHVVPWSAAMEMATDGRIEDAKTLVGLFHYDRIRANNP